jgi:hypothetical protein
MGDAVVVFLVFRSTNFRERLCPNARRGRVESATPSRFTVDEYWKSTPGRSVTLYGLDDDMDCPGDGEYVVGTIWSTPRRF